MTRRDKHIDTSSDEILSKLFGGSLVVLLLGLYVNNHSFITLGAAGLGILLVIVVVYYRLLKKHQRHRKFLFDTYLQTFDNFIHRNKSSRGDVAIGHFKFESSDIELFAEEFSHRHDIDLSYKDAVIILEQVITSLDKERIAHNTFLTSDTKSLNNLDSESFELLLRDLFTAEGYHVDHNGGVGDQGADLILTKSGQRIVVQAKRYSSAVSNKAVQEAVAAKAVHGCTAAWVVATNHFTSGARENAEANNVLLIDRSELLQRLQNSLGQQWI